MTEPDPDSLLLGFSARLFHRSDDGLGCFSHDLPEPTNLSDYHRYIDRSARCGVVPALPAKISFTQGGGRA